MGNTTEDFTEDDRYPFSALNVNDDRARGLTIDSKYTDLDSITQHTGEYAKAKYCALHINIHGLASKISHLKNIISQLKQNGITIHFILLCETFLNDVNCNMYQIPGYSFMHNSRKSLSKGGVAMYILDTLSFVERPDLSTFIEGQFECIFTEIKGRSGNKSIIVGEIYRPPNTNEKEAISRYDQIMSSICKTNNDVIIGTDQNFDFMKINQNTNVSDLLDVFYTRGVLPTITRPTRITYTSATLIDNIYVKSEYLENVASQIIIS